MCIRSNSALAVGIAALTVAAGAPLAASLRVHAHEWAISTTDERRARRVPPVAVRALDMYEVGVPVEVQRVQPQLVDGQLAIEVIEESAPLASDSAELRRPDPWDLQPGESALYGIEIARSVHFCDAIA